MITPTATNLQITLNGHTAAQLTDAYYHEYFTDTADFVKITIHLRDHRTIAVVSNSQLPYMLPWVVYGPGIAPYTTYDARLSRAIAALLPAAAPSRYLFGKAAFESFDWPSQDRTPTSLLYRGDGVGWMCLSAYLTSHPKTFKHIHFDGTFSLPLEEQNAFYAYEYKHGRLDWIDDAAGQLQLFTWLTLADGPSSADWLIGPNNLATFLWRHSGATIVGLSKSQYCQAVSL